MYEQVKHPLPPYGDRPALLPKHINNMTSSALARMGAPPLPPYQRNAKLIQSALYVSHYSEIQNLDLKN